MQYSVKEVDIELQHLASPPTLPELNSITIQRRLLPRQGRGLDCLVDRDLAGGVDPDASQPVVARGAARSGGLRSMLGGWEFQPPPQQRVARLGKGVTELLSVGALVTAAAIAVAALFLTRSDPAPLRDRISRFAGGRQRQRPDIDDAAGVRSHRA